MSTSLLSAPTDKPFPHATRTNSRAVLQIALLLSLCLMLCPLLVAQENFLVVTQDGVFSLYDLATNSLIESFKGSPFTYTVASSPNNRLAFAAGGGGYGSVVDTSISRTVTSLKGVRAPASTMTPDGKFYLAADYSTSSMWLTPQS